MKNAPLAVPLPVAGVAVTAGCAASSAASQPTLLVGYLQSGPQPGNDGQG